MMAGAPHPRRLQHQLGYEPMANCFRTGTTSVSSPAGSRTCSNSLPEDVRTAPGEGRGAPQQEGGGDLFGHPLGRLLRRPGTYTCMGYMMLLHEIGLDYPSAPTPPKGELRPVHLPQMIKRLNAKIYAEAKRLGVKCPRRRVRPHVAGHPPVHGHDERPHDFLEEPVSPITDALRERPHDEDGAHRRIHRRFDPSRQAEAWTLRERRLPGHLSRLLQPRRAMGLFEEPRTSSRTSAPFHEMAKTRSGRRPSAAAAVRGSERRNEEMRMRGGCPGHGRQSGAGKYG